MFPPKFNAPVGARGIKIMFNDEIAQAFSIDHQLGESGSVGKVYQVTEKETKKKYALKVIRVDTPGGRTDFPKVRDAIAEYHEVQNAVKEFKYHNIAATDHATYDKHFLQVYDIALVLGSERDDICILMEKADGSLFDAHKLFGHVTAQHFCEWLSFILQGIRVMHKKDLVHRDLHPGNILFVGKRPVIADFGQSCFAGVCINEPIENSSSMAIEAYKDVDTLLQRIMEAHNLIAHQQGQATILSESMKNDIERARKAVKKYAHYLEHYKSPRERVLRMKRDKEVTYDEMQSMEQLDHIVSKIRTICKAAV